MRPRGGTLATEPSYEARASRLSRQGRACGLFPLQGGVCRNGGDDAFLGDATFARVRLANPDMTERAMLSLYLRRVPPVVSRDSGIFHAKNGCTSDRSLRADVCNAYYCGGLSVFMKTGAAAPTRVIAGEADSIRTSPVLAR
jgi:hypothetical protein